MVEDEPLVSALLVEYLRNAGFDAHASRDALQAREDLLSIDPDAAIIDINLGNGPSGIQFGQWVHRSNPQVALVFLTKHPDSRITGERNWKLPPGSTFLAKERISHSSALFSALETALDQSKPPLRHDLQASGPLSSLTKTQFMILQMAAQGLSNQEIAKRRGTSERTVEQRLQAVYHAMSIHADSSRNQRAQAIRLFLQAGGFLYDEQPWHGH